MDMTLSRKSNMSMSKRKEKKCQEGDDGKEEPPKKRKKAAKWASYLKQDP